ncbi:MAG: cytochrome c biogenesis CcdA family protein [Chloroflexota bacterium]
MADLVPQVGLLVAFGAGIISFLSPCVAPLVPGYLSYVSGATFDGKTTVTRKTHEVLIACLLFVLGFSIVFVLLGASVSLVGGLLDENRRLLNRAAGVTMILMGLFITGLVKMPWMNRDMRFHPNGGPSRRGGPVLLGMTFAFGWTPCVGPILASILFWAGASQTAAQGALSLFAYSLGLGVPFVLVGVGFSRALGAVAWMRRHFQALNIVSGSLLVGLGILFLTDRFYYFSIALQRFYYTLLQ